MSAANILGNGNFAGTVSENFAFKYWGSIPIPAAAGPSPSAAVLVPYLKSSDTVLIAFQSGAVPAGAMSFAVANSGAANATLTISAAGAVGAGGANMLVMVCPGAN